jgi:prepilin-type N-terminal cleavage/methylation domain-containing protein
MKRNQKGFSLPELLIVVAVIGIIASIAIPGLLAAQKASREAAAIQGLRSIVSAENTYLSVQGNYSTYGAPADLSAAKLMDATLFTVPINGYQVSLTLNGTSSSYTATNEPSVVTSTSRFFMVSTDGVIHYKFGSTASDTDPNIPN